MNLHPEDVRFAEHGLSVVLEGRAARITEGEEPVEIAQVGVRNGELVFVPERSAKQRAVLRRIGALD